MSESCSPQKFIDLAIHLESFNTKWKLLSKITILKEMSNFTSLSRGATIFGKWTDNYLHDFRKAQKVNQTTGLSLPEKYSVGLNNSMSQALSIYVNAAFCDPTAIGFAIFDPGEAIIAAGCNKIKPPRIHYGGWTSSYIPQDQFWYHQYRGALDNLIGLYRRYPRNSLR